MSKEHFPYDRTLRELFQSIPKRFTEIIADKRVTRVLDPSFPSVKERKADFLGCTSGVEIIAEDITSFGRIDVTVKMPKAIYVIEFKTDGEVAIEQIISKGYHEQYLSDGRAVYIVAIEFDTTKKNITAVKWQGMA